MEQATACDRPMVISSLLDEWVNGLETANRKFEEPVFIMISASVFTEQKQMAVDVKHVYEDNKAKVFEETNMAEGYREAVQYFLDDQRSEVSNGRIPLYVPVLFKSSTANKATDIAPIHSPVAFFVCMRDYNSTAPVQDLETGKFAQTEEQKAMNEELAKVRVRLFEGLKQLCAKYNKPL
jgi:hypothetical protein